VYQLSNQVVPVTLDELLEGRLRTTRGTDLDCVVKHALERDFSCILVVTDGEGGLDDALRARAERRGVQVFAVLTSAFTRDSPIIRIARQWWALPEGMRGRTRRRWIAGRCTGDDHAQRQPAGARLRFAAGALAVGARDIGPWAAWARQGQGDHKNRTTPGWNGGRNLDSPLLSRRGSPAGR
jgi:hypothetical protein